MSDANHARPATDVAGSGDGDLYDPSVHQLDDDDLAPIAGAGAEVDGTHEQDPPADDDLVARDSEVEDVTTGAIRPDDTGLTDASGEPVDLSEVDVAALLTERDEFKSLAQRIQADFDNFRRQSVQRARDDADRATGRLAEAFLPVLDAAEAAFLNHPDEVGPLLNQMLTELRKHGLETLDLDGQPFDPEVAEAVAHEPGDGGDPVVAEVLRSGYQWKGKTLRAAMVKTKD